MRIRTRLFLVFFFLTILPLAAIGYYDLQAIEHVSQLTIAESSDHMKDLGETAIRQKALDVALQVQLFFEAHPNLASDPELMIKNKDLASIAVQPVGVTGYTALYDSNGITWFHSNPKLVGQDMHAFAATLPEFWAIFDASLDGTIVGSYYLWKEPDNSLREKYMECVPVGETQYRIAATTYIDEFYQPIRATEQKAQTIFVQTRWQTNTALVAVAGFAVLVAFWLSSYISRPVVSLISASRMVEEGKYSSVNLGSVEKRKDELGGLARVFTRMVEEMRNREQHLKNEVKDLQTKVQLFIEIDLANKDNLVREITETEYFENLTKRVQNLRKKKEQGE